MHDSDVALERRQQSDERAALQIVRNEETRDQDCANPLQRRTPQREEIVRAEARRVCQLGGLAVRAEEAPGRALVGARVVMGNSPDLVLRMAASGAGIVLAEHGSAESYVKAGQLVRVLPEWEIQPVPLSAVFPGRRLMPARTRAFIDALVDKFGGSKRA